MQDWVYRLGSVFFSSFFFWNLQFFSLSLSSWHTFGQVQYQMFHQIFSVLFLLFLCSDRLSKSGFDLFILSTYYENDILFRKIFSPDVRKNCSSDREKLLKVIGRRKAKNLPNFRNHLINLFNHWNCSHTIKTRSISGNV